MIPAIGLDLQAGLFARGRVVAAVDDAAWLAAMLDFEVALAAAMADAGLGTRAAADEIAASCRRNELDVAALGSGAAAYGTPVPPLLAALRKRLSPAAGSLLHRGATSQDVLDSAAMLIARRALGVLLEDLEAAADEAAALAGRHRDDVMAGRTLMEQALPITFGLKAATWLTGLDQAGDSLGALSARLCVQFGGGAGTLASLGDRGPEVTAALAGRLELAEPGLPWQAIRVLPAQLAAALGVASSVAGKIGMDVLLMAQTEVGEAAEGGGGGGSSTLPQKQNPVAAVAAIACARRTPGLVASMLLASVGEHERGAGSWQVEAEVLSDLLRLSGSGIAAVRSLLEGLEVDPLAMRSNINRAGGTLMAEALETALATELYRAEARALLRRSPREPSSEVPLSPMRRRRSLRFCGLWVTSALPQRWTRLATSAPLMFSSIVHWPPTPSGGGIDVACSVHHIVEGPEDGPVVVLLNSLGADISMWEPQAEVLKWHFRTVRLDTRGHGRSPVPPGPYTIEDLGGDAIALLDRLGIERASFCGVSLGGAIAMWLAVNFPQRVDRLTICFSAPHFGGPEPWFDRASLVRAAGVGAVADAVLDRWFTSAFRAERPDSYSELRAMLAATPPEGYAACCEAVAGIDLSGDLSGIGAPTLVISGAEDPATPPAQGRRIASAVSGAAFAEIPDAAHLGNLERPELVSSLLLAHLHRSRQEV